MRDQEFDILEFARRYRHFTLLEQGVFIEMVIWCLHNWRTLPLDRAQLCRIVRAVTTDEMLAVKSVVTDAFTEEADGYHNEQIDRMLFVQRQHEQDEAGSQ